MLFLIKPKKKVCFIQVFNLIKFILFFIFFLYIIYKKIFDYTLEKNFKNLFDIYIYYNFYCFFKLISSYVIYDIDLFLFLLENKYSILINSFFNFDFNKLEKRLTFDFFRFTVKNSSRKTVGYLNNLRLRNNNKKNKNKNKNNLKLYSWCEAHRHYCFNQKLYDSEIKKNNIFDIHVYFNSGGKKNNIIIHDFLSSRYYYEFLKLNQKFKMSFEIESFLIQNNFILIMDGFKHNLFCKYFKNEFLSIHQSLFEKNSLSLLEKYQKNYFFRDFFFNCAIPLDNFILTIDSFNLYLSFHSNLNRIEFVINNFENDYSVFLYDPLIIFNQLLVYFFDYNFLLQNFDSDQNLKILNFYLSKYLIMEFDFDFDFSNFQKIESFFLLNNVEQNFFENSFLILIHIYSLFYRINFEIYLHFHSIEINIFISTIHSLIYMNRPREFSLVQFDLSKSKQVEKVCNGFIRRKNWFSFFIAFTFYLLPVLYGFFGLSILILLQFLGGF